MIDTTKYHQELDRIQEDLFLMIDRRCEEASAILDQNAKERIFKREWGKAWDEAILSGGLTQKNHLSVVFSIDPCVELETSEYE